jgi:hypothetical protein
MGTWTLSDSKGLNLGSAASLSFVKRRTVAFPMSMTVTCPADIGVFGTRPLFPWKSLNYCPYLFNCCSLEYTLILEDFI